MGETIGVYTSGDFIQLVAPAYHFKGLLPETGGIGDQDEMVMRDIYMWSAGMARAQYVWDSAHNNNTEQ